MESHEMNGNTGGGVFENVTRRYGGVTAVDDVSFTLAAGEVIGVVGQSGSGKSTLGRLVLGVDPRTAIPAPLPCTPAGIVELLERNGVEIAGKHVTVIGRGITVGRPLGLLLTRKGTDATVTLTHSRTVDLAAEVRRADIVVAAVGVPHLVKADWIKPGAAVLDVGVTRVGTTETGRAKLAGDIDPAVAEVAGWLSPNPGGVGPMTRALLVSNVVEAAERALAL